MADLTTGKDGRIPNINGGPPRSQHKATQGQASLAGQKRKATWSVSTTAGRASPDRRKKLLQLRAHTRVTHATPPPAYRPGMRGTDFRTTWTTFDKVSTQPTPALTNTGPTTDPQRIATTVTSGRAPQRFGAPGETNPIDRTHPPTPGPARHLLNGPAPSAGTEQRQGIHNQRHRPPSSNRTPRENRTPFVRQAHQGQTAPHRLSIAPDPTPLGGPPPGTGNGQTQAAGSRRTASLPEQTPLNVTTHRASQDPPPPARVAQLREMTGPPAPSHRNTHGARAGNARSHARPNTGIRLSRQPHGLHQLLGSTPSLHEQLRTSQPPSGTRPMQNTCAAINLEISLDRPTPVEATRQRHSHA